MSASDDRGPRKSGGVAAISFERRRACRWLLLPAAQLVAPSWAWAGAAGIATARMWPAQEYTRVVFEFPARVPHAVARLSDPHRVVLDLEGVPLTSEIGELPSRVQASDPYVAAIRFGKKSPDTLRVVFDLKAEASAQLFTLDPVADFGYRVVLDLYPLTPVDPLMALLQEKRELPAVDARPAAGPPERAADTKPEGRRESRRRITVAIDPGHGGEDPGAIGSRGTYEKNVALAIAKKLKRIVDAEPGMRAMLTRDDDYYVPLAARVQKARRVQADLFVSIHADAFQASIVRLKYPRVHGVSFPNITSATSGNEPPHSCFTNATGGTHKPLASGVQVVGSTFAAASAFAASALGTVGGGAATAAGGGSR